MTHTASVLAAYLGDVAVGQLGDALDLSKEGGTRHGRPSQTRMGERESYRVVGLPCTYAVVGVRVRVFNDAEDDVDTVVLDLLRQLTEQLQG